MRLEDRLPVRCPDCDRLVASSVGLNAHRRMMHSVGARRVKPGVRETVERVAASVLRPHDRLEMPSGQRFTLLDVVHDAGEVRLRSETLGGSGGAGKWFQVAPHTMFVRVVQDRTIDTRPDLKEQP